MRSPAHRWSRRQADRGAVAETASLTIQIVATESPGYDAAFAAVIIGA